MKQEEGENRCECDRYHFYHQKLSLSSQNASGVHFTKNLWLIIIIWVVSFGFSILYTIMLPLKNNKLLPFQFLWFSFFLSFFLNLIALMVIFSPLINRHIENNYNGLPLIIMFAVKFLLYTLLFRVKKFLFVFWLLRTWIKNDYVLSTAYSAPIEIIV